MARQLRIQYPGALYHVMNRGDRREDIFVDDHDRKCFVVRLTPAQFQLVPANAEVKVQLARRLRRETTLSLKWIAQQLGVGSWKYLSNLLGQEEPNSPQAQLGL